MQQWFIGYKFSNNQGACYPLDCDLNEGCWQVDNTMTYVYTQNIVHVRQCHDQKYMYIKQCSYITLQHMENGL